MTDESNHNLLENDVPDDLQWSDIGPPKHWQSPNAVKNIKNVAVLPCSLLVKFDKNKTALEVIKNTERVVENISLELRNGTIFDKVSEKNKALTIATAIGIVGITTTAIGISLLIGGPLTAGWGIATASVVTETATAATATAATATAATATAATATAATATAATATAATTTAAVASSTAAGSASVAAGSAALAAASVGIVVAQTFHSKNGKKRLVVLGKKKGDCKVGLVRPNIIIDEEWDAIVSNIIKLNVPNYNHNQNCRGPKIFKQGLSLLNWRKGRDSDINSCELAREEKMFLLISRGLNDKKSTFSIVYKRLILELKERASNNSLSSECKREDGDRSIRQDVHAIIKHITAVLLQDRPEFGSSAELTEISASCVESLVLSEVYDVVFDEIKSQTREEDQKLKEKIQCYHQSQNSPFKIFNFIKSRSEDGDKLLCGEAIEALQSIPSHRTVQMKLRCCAEVLKAISDHGMKENLSADRLLESVCHHIVHARVPNLNAECLFVEEFATDEQLVRGLEGYALITLLASLSYLNNCDCIDA